MTKLKNRPLPFYAPTLGDGIEGLLSLRAGSVSLVLSDLPSGETAAKFDQVPELKRFWPAVWHALKARGCAVLMGSSIRFAAALIASQPKAFRYDLIWEKSLATGHLNSATRPLRAHEFILVFSRGGTTTFNPQYLETGVPVSSVGDGVGMGSENYGRPSFRNFSRAGATDRHPRSVVRFGSLPTTDIQRIHPQQKPHALLRNLVLQYSNPGELVADPFAGSGSSIEAARSEGRRAVGWDSSPRFGVKQKRGSAKSAAPSSQRALRASGAAAVDRKADSQARIRWRQRLLGHHRNRRAQVIRVPVASRLQRDRHAANGPHRLRRAAPNPVDGDTRF